MEEILTDYMSVTLDTYSLNFCICFMCMYTNMLTQIQYKWDVGSCEHKADPLTPSSAEVKLEQ